MIESSVIDAGPLIHLDELRCLYLLEGFGTIYLPPVVLNEVVAHRPRFNLDTVACAKIATPRISRRVTAFQRTLGLDRGETAALHLVEELKVRLFLCDDSAARLAAESLDCGVHGTIGVLVRAIRRGTRTPGEVKTTLKGIHAHSTLHVSRALLERVIQALP